MKITMNQYTEQLRRIERDFEKKWRPSSKKLRAQWDEDFSKYSGLVIAWAMNIALDVKVETSRRAKDAMEYLLEKKGV